MKKQIIILFCLSVLSFNVFAGKPVSKEPSPLSVLESEEEKKSWFERHLWVIALFVALFLVRMCGELSRG